MDYITDIIELYEADLYKVKRYEWALIYVKEQTPEICMAAVQKNIYALQYVKDLELKEQIRLELNL